MQKHNIAEQTAFCKFIPREARTELSLFIILYAINKQIQCTSYFSQSIIIGINQLIKLYSIRN